jgi:prophage regulatory protein
MYPKQLVSKKELRTVCGIPYSPQHIARLEAAGKFPKRVQLGQNRVAWLLKEVEGWLDERIAARACAGTARAGTERRH